MNADDLEQLTRWYRIKIDTKQEQKLIELSTWCIETFGNSGCFRFGNSFFFENREDKLLFTMVHGYES